MDNTIYKIATKYKYEGDSQIVKPGDVFLKKLVKGKDIEGDEVTPQELGELYIAVDNMLYAFSNQWVEGFDPEELLRDVTNIMDKINRKNLSRMLSGDE